ATDLWLDDMYLSNPAPLPINSNPFFLFPRQKFATTDEMLLFATRVIQFATDFKLRIDLQTLTQDYGSGHGKGRPLCMETYKNFFHSCRTPHEDKDRLLRQSRRSNHIVVVSCNQFYILRLGQDPLDNPYRTDMPPLDESCIFDQLSRIYRVSREQFRQKKDSIPKVGLLTTENRKTWAHLHKRLIENEINLKSISQIEDCLFVMCLDSIVKPEATSRTASNRLSASNRPRSGEQHDKTYAAQLILHGGSSNLFAANRWFDKFLQVIVGRNGVCGINIEHSASEGITVLRFLEEFLDYLNKPFNKTNGDGGQGTPVALNRTTGDEPTTAQVPSNRISATRSPSNSTSDKRFEFPPSSAGRKCSSSSSASITTNSSSHSCCGPVSPSLVLSDESITPLEWVLTDPIIQKALVDAETNVNKLIDDFQIHILEFKHFGKSCIKSHRMSPDAFIQLAMQLTYYRCHKQLVSTYESASLRQFRLGRVDNIRANTIEALQWVKSMADYDNKADDDVLDQQADLLLTAINRQVEILRHTITGNGPDNHLLALRELGRARYDDLPQLFRDSSYTEFLRFKLSTSQLPNERGITVGYGAVVSDGYGCSYNPCEMQIIFCVSAFASCPETNVDTFASLLEKSLFDMRNLCEYLSQRNRTTV
ncbi:Choline O-acetyltransferase, partial [Fragariocoptes setiger]